MYSESGSFTVISSNEMWNVCYFQCFCSMFNAFCLFNSSCKYLNTHGFLSILSGNSLRCSLFFITYGQIVAFSFQKGNKGTSVRNHLFIIILMLLPLHSTQQTHFLKAHATQRYILIIYYHTVLAVLCNNCYHYCKAFI